MHALRVIWDVGFIDDAHFQICLTGNAATRLLSTGRLADGNSAATLLPLITDRDKGITTSLFP